MIIISDKKSEIVVKIPNNFKKIGGLYELTLKNTETKVSYVVEFTDTEESDHYFIFSYVFKDIPNGEYEYVIGENNGLLRIEDRIEKKVYDTEISFKAYEG